MMDWCVRFFSVYFVHETLVGYYSRRNRCVRQVENIPAIESTWLKCDSCYDIHPDLVRSFLVSRVNNPHMQTLSARVATIDDDVIDSQLNHWPDQSDEQTGSKETCTRTCGISFIMGRFRRILRRLPATEASRDSKSYIQEYLRKREKERAW